MRRFAILTLAALTAGCSIGADVPVAATAAAGFHRQLDAGKFAETYAAAAPELRGATSQQDWIKLLDAVHRKLGKFQSATQSGWNDQMNTGGHFIVLALQSKYEKGAASEEFVYRIDGGKAQLAGYHVSSNALIVN